MRSFTHTALPMRVVFGPGSLARLPEEVDALGLTRVLVLCSPEQAATGQLVADALGAPLDAVLAAYEEQCAFVEGAGAQVILMASRALAAAAGGPEDYASVYARVLGGLERPAILHWLGPMFDPALAGYWGDGDLGAAAPEGDLAAGVGEDHGEGRTP